MEEILASIRRIISEDGAEAQPQATAAPAAKPAVAPAASPQAEPKPAASEPAAPAEEETLELTEVVKDDGTVVSLHPPAAPPTAPEPELEPEPEPAFSAAAPEPQPEPEPPPREAEDGPPAPAYESGLVSATTAGRAAASFGGLSQFMTGTRDMPLGAGGRTLEELVRELLRPMLKDWLDTNLPGIVQRAVEREIARLADQGETSRRR